MLLIALVMALLADAQTHPRQGFMRAGGSLGFRLALWIGVYGALMGLLGNIGVAGLLVIGLAWLICIISNLKYRVLGEPLVFADFAAAPALARQPLLWWPAVPLRDRIIAAAIIAVCLFLGVAGFSGVLEPRAGGVLLMLLAFGVMHLAYTKNWLRSPALLADAGRHGVPLLLLMYWRRWRDERAAPVPIAAPVPPPEADLIVILQSNAFADPQRLGLDLGLPGLATATAHAWCWGELAVTAFGGNAMRTQYGVLFGIDDDDLGFRAFNPWLTARRQAAYALTRKLEGFRATYVNPSPFDPASRPGLAAQLGFAEVIGPERFAQTGTPVADEAVADEIQRLIAASRGPTLIHAVLSETAGPWSAASYPAHLANADAALDRVMDAIAASGRSAVLAFYGAHQPAHAGLTAKSSRATPFAVLRFTAGRVFTGDGAVTLTPAALHQKILNAAALRATASLLAAPDA